MTQLVFDRLTYVDRLTKAGLGEDVARAHADGLEQALREEVATKRDVQRLETATKQDFMRLEYEIQKVVIKLGSVVAIATGILLAAMRLLPGGHS